LVLDEIEDEPFNSVLPTIDSDNWMFNNSAGLEIATGISLVKEFNEETTGFMHDGFPKNPVVSASSLSTLPDTDKMPMRQQESGSKTSVGEELGTKWDFQKFRDHMWNMPLQESPGRRVKKKKKALKSIGSPLKGALKRSPTRAGSLGRQGTFGFQRSPSIQRLPTRFSERKKTGIMSPALERSSSVLSGTSSHSPSPKHRLKRQPTKTFQRQKTKMSS
jgi:hypothetical protein